MCKCTLMLHTPLTLQPLAWILFTNGHTFEVATAHVWVQTLILAFLTCQTIHSKWLLIFLNKKILGIPSQRVLFVIDDQTLLSGYSLAYSNTNWWFWFNYWIWMNIRNTFTSQIACSWPCHRSYKVHNIFWNTFSGLNSRRAFEKIYGTPFIAKPEFEYGMRKLFLSGDCWWLHLI